ncbi:aminotransferase class III-fold pyridoxal phosphate-dependent enzyme [Candidatus Manganitrophus noduliformans]|uniref:Aspartate aminotransferase family protein n=1 Tax=Candidatus Manganitrophus noduliformans TaxID=2606439 RepID=A0A7X6DMQ4_9BACT|nr:aspartate aminotransferase family protein [Candidatus Manganitrophus noduliformans]NKE70078.1 aspartate aminotransferase family protein [Candidatus Manganitrophus noduliformans]
MTSLRRRFRRYVCQTSPHPIGLEIDRASGSYLYTTDGKAYLDFISGIGVANIGHTNRAVVKAVKTQAERYLHVMVYGEYIQSPQVELATRLAQCLPKNLSQVYFTNSGTEANEGALKLAKKWTGRKRLISFEGSFHGDTHGACSVTGREIYRKPFEPLLPGVAFLPFNDLDALKQIDDSVAAVITEPIQGEGGMRIPDDRFLPALRARCTEAGALLIFDEVQTGFGRTGKLFAMEHSETVPDILTVAKSMGGGMPLGAFISSPAIMKSLSVDPPLSHVTTFGGHPVCCAAGLASLNFIVENDLPGRAKMMGEKLQAALRKLGRECDAIRAVRGKGLMIGLELASPEQTARFVQRCLKAGLILGWTLHTNTVVRIAPPLTLSEKDLREGLRIIEKALKK